MEKEINIAEILKDKPQGTKLYTDAFGELSIEDICTEDEQGITLLDKDRVELFFYNDGRYSIFGEPILVPSKLMRDWSKFAWKKGDVLVGKDNVHVIFEKFENDDYTRFKGKYYLWEEYAKEDNSEDVPRMPTSSFEKANDYEAQSYINTIEERLGGKLNLETLEIEKTQPEFKDGDILSVPSTALPKNHIFIFSKFNKYKDFEHHVALTASGKITTPTSHGAWCRKDSGVKYATEEEKQQLFEALAKEGKAWDDEKKQIVDLKPKWTPKPFDRVLVRNTDTEEWFPGFFEKFDSTWNNPYHIMNRRSMTDFAFKQCIPYEGNEHLLGTTNNVDG